MLARNVPVVKPTYAPGLAQRLACSVCDPAKRNGLSYPLVLSGDSGIVLPEWPITHSIDSKDPSPVPALRDTLSP